MTRNHILVLLCLSHFTLLSSAKDDTNPNHQPGCETFKCGKLGNLTFPFYDENGSCYGLYKLHCSDPAPPKIQLKHGGHWFEVESISQADAVTIISDPLLKKHLSNPLSCESTDSFEIPLPSPVSNLTASFPLPMVVKCNQSVVSTHFQRTNRCGDYHLFLATNLNTSDISNLISKQHCWVIQVPKPETFTLEVHVDHHCYGCAEKGGKCETDSENNKFRCSIDTRKGNNKTKLKLGLGLGIPLGVLICLIIGFFLRRRYIEKRKAFLSRNVSDPYMNSDLEAGSVYYGVPLFSYKDLEEATNNFDSEKELGDGGFGTVYHGVLKDGRQVAVKRLYEHNYKRVEQFINEIEILTRLRHRNLVTLYGCTSRRSRELLLVYEYISNGTVADHLHGDRAATSPLTWPLRMSIAVETATALAYLHKSDTVHRDVKTSNILLDHNFCVKVADFGLSRLFPNDVTHVSTAPQGTPGYVDPEYHQCYQLTSKSDVYSFGVVLVELISSMPAVDITRHRHEINLSNLAMSKIRKQAYDELVDPRLGFGSNPEAKRMIISVAELAFQCLQQDKEMRPTMEEVLEELTRIEKGNNVAESQDSLESVAVKPPSSPECDEACLLKNLKQEPPSPNTVTQNWPSARSSTPDMSA